MKFHSRSDWDARAPKHRSSIGDVYGCTIHWHGPGLGAYTHDRCPELVRSMQEFHMDSNGWSDLGYSFVACRHGHVYEGRGLGVRGAHDESLNANWYGIQAMVGEDDIITAALLAGLRDAIAYCRRNGAGNRINGHRDADNTACPGDELYAWAHGSPMEDTTMSAEDVWGTRLEQFASADDEGWDDGKRRADYILLFAAARAHSAPQRVWNQDVIAVPWDDEDNPTWQAGNAITGIWRSVHRVEDKLDALARAIEALADGQDETIRDAVHEALKDVSVTVTYETEENNS